MRRQIGNGRGPLRRIWFGYMTSSVTHLAGGLLLGSMWGTSLVQLVPPPQGTNAVDLTARQTIAIDATRVDVDPIPAMAVTSFGVETATVIRGNLQSTRHLVRSQTGEMPPAGVPTARRTEDTDATRGIESARRLAPRSRPAHTSPPAQEESVSELFRMPKRMVPDAPPATPMTASAPALPSMRQQGQDARSPQTVYSPAPAYPATALRQQLTGRVVLRVTVDRDGTVSAARILTSSGHDELDMAALAAVRKWRFEPARRLGVAIEKEIAVPITFRIAPDAF